MSGLREFLKSSGGQVVGIIAALLAVALMVYMIRGYFGQSDEQQFSSDRMFIDATTLKPFEHAISKGEVFPVSAPSGGNHGYPAELCYWTKDGKPKTEPTYVLLNSWVGKAGPTFCLDCGRLVIPHNPLAAAGAEPPPTQAEYRPSDEGGR